MRGWTLSIALLLVAVAALFAFEGAAVEVVDRCAACGARQTRARAFGIAGATTSSDAGYERWVQHVAPSHTAHAWRVDGVKLQGLGTRWIDCDTPPAPTDFPDLYRLLGADPRVVQLVGAGIAEFERGGAVSSATRRAARALLPEARRSAR